MAISPTLILTGLQILSGIKQNNTATPVIQEQKKDYTAYYVIGIFSFIFLLFIILLIIKKQKNI